MNIEKDWKTDVGYRAIVLMTDMGHRCGYVGLPAEHPLHGKNYSEECSCLDFPGDEPIDKRGILGLLTSQGKVRPEVVFNVHGGITYAGRLNGVTESDLWWFGYDCAHFGDAPAPGSSYPSEGVHRTLEYCVEECESLAEQMNSRIKKEPAP